MNDVFRRAAQRMSLLLGSPLAFLLAMLVVLVWALSGFFFGFEDTWQLVINTGTTIVTFLMVFLIQNTQNRHSRVLQMKLDELIVYTKGAHNELLAVEDLSDAEIDLLSHRLHGRERARMNGGPDIRDEGDAAAGAGRQGTGPALTP